VSDPTPAGGLAMTPGLRADPYPMYHLLRETQPVYAAPPYHRAFAFSRFADCETILRDSRWSSATLLRRIQPDGSVPAKPRRDGVEGTRMLAFTDPPEHTRVRKLMAKVFTPRAVASLRPRVQQLVDELLDEAAERGEMDVMEDMARVLPVTVICEVLGVPVEDRHRFRPWSEDATRTFDGQIDVETTTRARAGWSALVAYIDDLIDDHRAHPGDDLLSALIAAEEEGDRLTRNELRVNAIGLLVAGHETTTNLIGNGTHALLRHPEQLARWHEDPSLTGPAVEELLRYDPMVQLVIRAATADVEVGGQAFQAGDNAIVLIGAANRDPERFPDPDRLDLGRADGAHLTFSHGVHHCLGAALARLEGQVALGSLVERFPHMQLVTPETRYRDHLVLRGLTELRVAGLSGTARRPA
jgi:cytochrome P450